MELQFGDGVARFEPVDAKAHHDHLICQKCGKTEEVHSEAIEVLQRELADSYGYRLLGHAHYLYGLCPDCRRRGVEDNGRSSGCGDRDDNAPSGGEN